MCADDDNSDHEEGQLFRRAVGDSRPLGRRTKVPADRPKPKPKARFRRADDAEVLAESLLPNVDEIETSAGEALRFGRPAVGRRTLRKLARGGFSVQAELDLHGMTAEEARQVLRGFIAEAGARGYTCIRVVHGKGLGSGRAGPVLKRKVNSWLRRWDEVLAFASAPQVHGGTGALFVLLRKP